MKRRKITKKEYFEKIRKNKERIERETKEVNRLLNKVEVIDEKK